MPQNATACKQKRTAAAGSSQKKLSVRGQQMCIRDRVGVEPDVIAKYNVVSAPVAAQMALGAAQAAGAEIGINVTGVAGPTGGDARCV